MVAMAAIPGRAVGSSGTDVADVPELPGGSHRGRELCRVGRSELQKPPKVVHGAITIFPATAGEYVIKAAAVAVADAAAIDACSVTNRGRAQTVADRWGAHATVPLHWYRRARRDGLTLVRLT